MQYVVTKRFKSKAACGDIVNLKWGTELQGDRKWILLPDGKLCCAATSENGHRHFSRNDDGQGRRRGELTWAIAFSTRRPGRVRFTDEERELLERKWQKFLKPDIDVILFNDAFFGAEIAELEEMATDLNIRA